MRVLLSSLVFAVSVVAQLKIEIIEDAYSSSTLIPRVIPKAFQQTCNSIGVNETLIPLVAGFHRDFNELSANFISSRTIGGSAPWTYEPTCVHNELYGRLCVYTSTSLFKGRGISLVAQPNEEKKALTAEALNIKQDQSDEDSGVADQTLLTVPRFVVQHVANKGQGLKATSTLHRGDEVYATRPVVLLPQTPMSNIRDPDKWVLMQIAVERLPTKTRNLFMSMKGHFGGDPYEDRINTNTFAARLGQASDIYWCAYPEAARINHDCRPK